MLTITVVLDPTAVTFRLDGRLAVLEVRELARIWSAAVLRRPQPRILFDLTGVSSMDTAGKAFLARAQAHGGTLIADNGT